MLRLLAVFAVILTVSQAAVPTARKTPDRPCDGGQRRNTTVQDSERTAKPTAAVATDQQNPHGDKQAESEKSSNIYGHATTIISNSAPMPDSWPLHDKITWIGQLILLFIGGFTLHWFIKQTKATQQAADAALRNTQAVINAERAWVMAEADFEMGGGLMYTDTGVGTTIELRIRNAGPTPAWVYEQWVQLKISPECIRSCEKYDSPQFPFNGEGKSAHVNYQIHPLTQGDETRVMWRAYVHDEGFPTPQSGLHVYVIGSVRYRDAFASNRETFFGYSIKGNNRLERIPNEAYNKHT